MGDSTREGYTHGVSRNASLSALASGEKLPLFTCGEKGPDILSFGRPPPEGIRCDWNPKSSPPCERPILLTEGLAIRFKVRNLYYVAWTCTGDNAAHSHKMLMWGISRDCETYSDPESWISPPSPGPSPTKAVRKLFEHIRARVGNFSQRERLGFNNVVMLAQLDRAFCKGVLPSSWRPCAESLLVSGKLSLSHSRDFFKADYSLQRDLAHLYPECNKNPQPYRVLAHSLSEVHSTQTSRLADTGNCASIFYNAE